MSSPRPSQEGLPADRNGCGLFHLFFICVPTDLTGLPYPAAVAAAVAAVVQLLLRSVQ
jgi:hypothetical protein